jgi:uncharacterized membrane protein YbaN (DUF454 family)
LATILHWLQAKENEMSGDYTMTTWMRAYIPLWRMILGWICLAVGVLGLLLPVLPGVPLLFGGLILLSANYRWARRVLHWLKRRLRKLAALKNRQQAERAIE